MTLKSALGRSLAQSVRLAVLMATLVLLPYPLLEWWLHPTMATLIEWGQWCDASARRRGWHCGSPC